MAHGRAPRSQRNNEQQSHAMHPGQSHIQERNAGDPLQESRKSQVIGAMWQLSHRYRFALNRSLPMICFITSAAPPAMRVMRASIYARAMG